MSQKVEMRTVIKQYFGQFMHSDKVLSRAIKSCRDEEILKFLDKMLEHEPRWQNKFNIVHAILHDNDLISCRFCNKALPYANVMEGKFYCSEQCEKTDLALKQSHSQPVGFETVQKTQSFIDKTKNFFRKLFKK